MDPTDAFFTQTVVGAPFTVLLGRRRQPARADEVGERRVGEASFFAFGGSG